MTLNLPKMSNFGKSGLCDKPHQDKTGHVGTDGRSASNSAILAAIYSPE
jgi:hypothetical protein